MDDNGWLQSVPAPLALLRKVGARVYIVDANRGFTSLIGKGEADIVGQRLISAFSRPAAIQLRFAVMQTLGSDEPVSVAIPHAVDLRPVHLEATLQSSRAAGRPEAVMHIAAAPSQERFSTVSEAEMLAEMSRLSRGFVFIKDMETGAYRSRPHPLIRRLGLTTLWKAQNIPVERVHPADLRKLQAYLDAQKAAGDDDVVDTVVRLLATENEWRWINLRSRVFSRDAAGAPARMLCIATDLTEGVEQADRITAMADAMTRAELDERHRIGRELHDSASQYLVAARLGLSAVSQDQQLTQRSAGILQNAEDAISRAQREIRAFSFMLHPPSLDGVRLAEALRVLANGFAQRTALRIQVAAGHIELSEEMELALYRVAQEALMNVYRHAEARSVKIQLGSHGETVALVIEDDGKGMPDEPPERRSLGVGIPSMTERITQLGGSLEIVSMRRGVKVVATVRAQARP